VICLTQQVVNMPTLNIQSAMRQHSLILCAASNIHRQQTTGSSNMLPDRLLHKQTLQARFVTAITILNISALLVVGCCCCCCYCCCPRCQGNSNSNCNCNSNICDKLLLIHCCCLCGFVCAAFGSVKFTNDFGSSSCDMALTDLGPNVRWSDPNGHINQASKVIVRSLMSNV